MAKAIPRGPLFRVEGIEPSDDPAWFLAGERGRKAFWNEVRAITLKIKDASLSKGLSIEGDVMQITEYTRKHRRSAMGPAYYRAPALTPSFEASRTRSYLRAEVIGEGVTCWWRHDHRTKGSWGLILQYQKEQGRNVIGLSADDLDKIYRLAHRWWATYRKRYDTPPKPTPVQVVLPMPVAVPQPVRKPAIAARPPIVLPPVVAVQPVLDWTDITVSKRDKSRAEKSAALGTFSGGKRHEKMEPGSASHSLFTSWMTAWKKKQKPKTGARVR
jgi:hypothetical protein